MEFPIELVVSILLGCLFTALISFGYGKQMTQSETGRPILGAIGFLIVIAGYSWHRHDFQLFTELAMWFIAVCFPVWLVGTINGEREKHGLRLEQHKPAAPGYLHDGRA